jgi:SAM-dependent methyltransferase
VADGANLELGCGNPNAIAELTEGETVVDLGSGGGFDCFLAAREVGEDGHVIGVDMTPEMVERARANVEQNDFENVEFRLGEIEHLPVSDERADAIISNCVINLSPRKGRVFEEAYRVLRPGGRLAIADVVMTADVPSELRRADPESVAACVAGASTIEELREHVESAGFESVSIRPKEDSEEFIREWSDEYPLEAYLTSAVVEAEKPREVDE